MSLWDKIKGFFGAGGPPPHDPELVREVRAILTVRCDQGELFEAADIADEACQKRSTDELSSAVAVVESLFDEGWFTERGYTRSQRVYHPEDANPAAYAAKRARRKSGASGAPSTGAAAADDAPPRPKPAVTDPLSAPELLVLSPEEFRRRALKIRPWATAWIGRVDTIPPQSDERTALIDRGLLLRGYLTRKQLTEIHRIGDLWLRHREAAKLAEAAAQHSVDEWFAEKRRAKAVAKEAKRKESAERRAKLAAEVAKRRAEDIVFLGRGVSHGLADRRAHVEELQRRGLPLLATPADVARALGLTVSRLRWLCFHAEAPTRTHYVYFEVPKKSGGKRLLAAPHEELKRAQHWVLESVLEKLPVTPSAHGFVPGRSTVSNATPHVGRDVVVNCDLADFFPTITFPRVRGVFEAIGYSPAVATVLALLCTEAPRVKAQLGLTAHWVAVGERALPQGAPTSPALSNQIARKLDQRLDGVARKLGWVYTRYADDLTFSAPPNHRPEIGWLLAKIRHVAQDEGFALNPKKCRVQRAAQRQEVTGIVVNSRPAIPREELRRLRAILHGAAKTGLAAQNREGHPHFEAWLRGKIAYVTMVDRAKGAALAEKLAKVAP